MVRDTKLIQQAQELAGSQFIHDINGKISVYQNAIHIFNKNGEDKWREMAERAEKFLRAFVGEQKLARLRCGVLV